MPRENQRVIIAETLTGSWFARKFINVARGKVGTVTGPVESDPGYWRLLEFPGLVFHESYLLPFDDSDDAAYMRFRNKLNLNKPVNPWTLNIDQL